MATIVEPDRIYTPEDLLTIDDGRLFELIDGHLVETGVSLLSELVASRVISHLTQHADRDDSGYVTGSGTLLRCFPGRPNRVRKPDACYVRRDRLDPRRLGEGFLTVAPDLVAEVVSPHDEAEDLERKIMDYLDAGIPLLWVIYPAARSAVVYRRDGSANRLREDDELRGEDVVPGFACRLGDLFPALPEPIAEG